LIQVLKSPGRIFPPVDIVADGKKPVSRPIKSDHFQALFKKVKTAVGITNDVILALEVFFKP
jgi:hypothetical protein